MMMGLEFSIYLGLGIRIPRSEEKHNGREIKLEGECVTFFVYLSSEILSIQRGK